MVDGSNTPLYIALQHNNDGATKMTSKATPTVKKVRTVAAPKTAPVAKPVAKIAAAPAEKPAQLVTNIVTVEPTPAKPIIAQGIVKMTEETKATETKATAETVTAKAKDFFADMQVKATEAAEKGKKLAADATEFSKANAEAVIEAAKIAAKGAQEMGQTNLEYAKKNFGEMQVAVKEITAVKSPTDFVKLQGEFARKGFDTAVAQTSKNTEAMVKLMSDMFQPISNRFAVATELFKKAA
jgi:phasin family protein